MADPAYPIKVSTSVEQTHTGELEFLKAFVDAQKVKAQIPASQTNGATISATDARIGDAMSLSEHGADAFNEFFRTVEELEGLVDLGKLVADLTVGFARDDIEALAATEFYQWLPSEKQGHDKLAAITEAASKFIDDLKEDPAATLMPDLTDLKEDHRYLAMASRVMGHAATFLGLLKLSRMNPAAAEVEAGLALQSTGARNALGEEGSAGVSGAELVQVSEVMDPAEAWVRLRGAIDATPTAERVALSGAGEQLAVSPGSMFNAAYGGNVSRTKLLPETTGLQTTPADLGRLALTSGASFHPDTVPDDLLSLETIPDEYIANDTYPGEVISDWADAPDTDPMDLLTVSTIPPDMTGSSISPSGVYGGRGVIQESGIYPARTPLLMPENVVEAAWSIGLPTEATGKLAGQLFNTYNEVLALGMEKEFSSVTMNILRLKMIEVWENMIPGFGHEFTEIWDPSSLDLMTLARSQPGLAEEIIPIKQAELKVYEAVMADPVYNSHPEIVEMLVRDIDQTYVDVAELRLMIMENAFD